MVTEAKILAVLLQFPVCWADRGDPRKPEQYATIARAVSVVADGSVDRAGKLLTLAFHEARNCLAVHSGEHRGPGRGLWQLEGKSNTYTGPFVGLSYDDTLTAARVAGHILDHSYQCGTSPRAIFTAYAGRACGTNWKTLDERVRTYRWVTWRLS